MTLQNAPEPNPYLAASEFLGQPRPEAPAVVDEEALATFYEAHIEDLCTYLARKAGRDSGVELASQIFEQFLVWWPDNPTHPTPVAALYRIAQCRLADHLRRHGRVLTVEAYELDKALHYNRWDDGYEAIVLRVDLDSALTTELNERQRQALLLRYVAELPVKECAEVLGLGIDNMKKILKQALQTLRHSPRMDAYYTAGRARGVHR